MSTSPMAGMEQHPDIAELRARYERASETTPAHMVHGLIFLCGLYLAISPWVIGFNGRHTTTGNNVLTGIAVALLALGLVSAYGRTHGIAWVIPLIGVWTIISHWVVHGHVATLGTIISNVVVGALIVLLGMAAAAFGMARLAGRTRKAGKAGRADRTGGAGRAGMMAGRRGRRGHREEMPPETHETDVHHQQP